MRTSCGPADRMCVQQRRRCLPKTVFAPVMSGNSKPSDTISAEEVCLVSCCPVCVVNALPDAIFDNSWILKSPFLRGFFYCRIPTADKRAFGQIVLNKVSLIFLPLWEVKSQVIYLLVYFIMIIWSISEKYVSFPMLYQLWYMDLKFFKLAKLMNKHMNYRLNIWNV